MDSQVPRMNNRPVIDYIVVLPKWERSDIFRPSLTKYTVVSKVSCIWGRYYGLWSQYSTVYPQHTLNFMEITFVNSPQLYFYIWPMFYLDFYTVYKFYI